MGVAAFKEDKKQKSSPAKRRARKQKSLIKQFKRLIPNTASAPLPKPPTPKFTPSVLPKLPGPGGMFVLDLLSDLIFPKSTADADLDDLPPEASLEPFQPQQSAEPYYAPGEPPFRGGQVDGAYYDVYLEAELWYRYVNWEDDPSPKTITSREYLEGPITGSYGHGDTDRLLVRAFAISKNYPGSCSGFSVDTDISGCGGVQVSASGMSKNEGGEWEREYVRGNYKVDRIERNDGTSKEDDVAQGGNPKGDPVLTEPPQPNRIKVTEEEGLTSPEATPNPAPKPKRNISDTGAATSSPSLDPAKGTDPFKQPSAETLTTPATETAAAPASQTATGTATTTATPEEATTASKFAPLTTGTVPTAFTAAGTSANNSRLPNSSAFEEPKSPPTTKPPDPCRSPDNCSSKGLNLLDELLDLVSLIRDNNCCDEILSILKGEYNGLNYTEYCATDENGEKSYKSEAIKYETEGLQSAMQLLQTSVTGEIEKLKRKLLCEELESNVVFPSGWNIRPEYWRPQLVIKFRGKSENGKLTNSWWSITVPHYNGQTRPQTSPIQEYRRGSVEGILTLNDNSKVTVHCASEGQALYILEGIRAYIDPKQTDGSYIKTGMIRSQSPIKTVNVVPWDAKYYSQGAKGQNPDWVAYFAPT